MSVVDRRWRRLPLHETQAKPREDTSGVHRRQKQTLLENPAEYREHLEEARLQQIVEQEKARLLAEHAAILQQHHPKANSYYQSRQ